MFKAAFKNGDYLSMGINVLVSLLFKYFTKLKNDSNFYLYTHLGGFANLL